MISRVPSGIDTLRTIRVCIYEGDFSNPPMDVRDFAHPVSVGEYVGYYIKTQPGLVYGKVVQKITEYDHVSC